MAAEAYAFLGSTGQMQPKEAFEIVHRYSDKAIELDSQLSAGYAAKGSAYLLYDWKWKEAYESLVKAIELNPASTDAHQLLSFYYLITGRKSDAVEIMEKALAVDPLSPIVNKSLVDAYLIAGRADDAIRQADSLLEMHPGMRVAMELKGWCYGAKGQWQKAAEIFKEVRLQIKHPLKGFTPIGCAYANMGETEKAYECIAKIEQWQREEPGVVVDADLAMIWLSLGEIDKAFYHLFRCVDKGIGPAAIIIEHSAFKVPRDDPRFKELKEKFKLAEFI